MGVARVYVVTANYEGESKIHIFAHEEQAKEYKKELEEKHPDIKVDIVLTTMFGEGGGM